MDSIKNLIFALTLAALLLPGLASATITCTGTDSSKSIAVGETGDITVSCSGIGASDTVTATATGYDSDCMSSQDSTVFTLNQGSPSSQRTFEATSMACESSVSDRTISWSFSCPGESISSRDTVVSITSPYTITASFANSPYEATAGSSVTATLEVSTGASDDITDVDADLSGSDTDVYGASKITDWEDNTIYASGSQKTIQKSWTFTAPSTAGTYDIEASVTSQNAGGDTGSTTLTVTSGGGDDPSSPSGGTTAGAAVAAPAASQAQNASRRPELVPGVGLRNNTRLQEAMQKVLGLANMSEQAKQNMLRISESISSQVQMRREFRYESQVSSMETRMTYSGNKKAKNFMLYDSVPKEFAQHAENLTVQADGAVGFEVVESDPELLFTYGELEPGDEITITYSVNEEVDDAVIDSFSGEVYAQELEDIQGCVDGATRCSVNDVQVCQDGEWVLQETCPSGCSNGQCVTGTTPVSPGNLTLWIIIALVAVVIGAFVVLMLKKRSSGPGKGPIKSNSPMTPGSQPYRPGT